MKLSIVEKSILDHLAAKGAATRLELATATGFSKSGVRNAIRTLVAGKRVKQHVLKREDGYKHRHRTFITATEAVTPPPTPEHAPENPTLNIFDHASLYNRLTALESQFKRLDNNYDKLQKDFVELSKDEVASYERLNKAVKLVNKLELHRIRIDEAASADRARMDGLAERLRALQPAVDPLYTEIEREITETLGGKYSPELLRGLIDSAYAEKAK
jgi:DNA-binding Lrp family transcriptional regulator